jgi:hypothetical protein
VDSFLIACVCCKPIASPLSMTPAFAAGATSQSDPSLLLAPGIGQGLGEASDREVRRCGAIDNRRCEAKGRQEGRAGGCAVLPGPHARRLLGHDFELLVDAAIAERNRSTDPEALALGGRDLVAPGRMLNIFRVIRNFARALLALALWHVRDALTKPTKELDRDLRRNFIDSLPNFIGSVR